jgi:hypothetical protein
VLLREFDGVPFTGLDPNLKYQWERAAATFLDEVGIIEAIDLPENQKAMLRQHEAGLAEHSRQLNELRQHVANRGMTAAADTVSIETLTDRLDKIDDWIESAQVDIDMIQSMITINAPRWEKPNS